jgi:hypothetical protein
MKRSTHALQYTNVILAKTWEYRLLRPGENDPETLAKLENEKNEDVLKKAVPSRFVGLVTIRGGDATRIQAEMEPDEEGRLGLI